MIALVLLSALFGGCCGTAAFLSGFGFLQSLAIYAAAGQLPFLVLPLILSFRMPPPPAPRSYGLAAPAFE